jgi:uncharacterized membrane protein
MTDYVNKLLEMAEHFNAAGDAELAKELRYTASRILDAVLYNFHGKPWMKQQHTKERQET